ncbi:MAG: phosphoribulokinase, partial [Sedimenticola sp.]|nr:phosphoribulokinase [Sedimenticola sp.]
MSKQHPIVAVTGSSGAGTSTVKRAFEHIFYRDGVTPAIIEGDSYHRYDRVAMREAVAEASKRGQNLSHFGPDSNLFGDLENLFKSYSETGTGKKRYYLHSEEEAIEHNERLATNLNPGEFTPWEDLPSET